MSVNPPHWLAAVVRLLVPPPCREHVLGDLQERLSATDPAHPGMAYLVDAARTVPLVVWSQIRRTTDPGALRVKAAMVYAGFVSGAFYAYGGAAPSFLGAQHGTWLLLVPTVVVLVVLAVADAYTAHRESSWPFQSVLPVLALAVAWTINLILASVNPQWSIPPQVKGWGSMMALGSLQAMRYLWTARYGKPGEPVAQGRVDLYTQAQRLARGTRHRTASGYVVGIGMTMCFGWFAYVTSNRVASAGAALTATACLYITYQLRQARPSALPPAGPASEWMPVYRAELIRQRDFHGGPRFWYRMGAMVPGYFLFLTGLAMARPESIGRFSMIGAAFLLFGLFAFLSNRRLARTHQRQLDVLHEERP